LRLILTSSFASADERWPLSFGSACEVKAVQEWRPKSGKLILTNEVQPADHWSHYTPYAQLQPFRIDPAVMGMFDPDYPRPSARPRRVPIAGSLAPFRRQCTRLRRGSPAECPAAADRPGAKSDLGDHDLVRAGWWLRKVHYSIL
jgi:hypothetical protein